MKPIEVKINVTDHITKADIDRLRDQFKDQKPVTFTFDQLASLGITQADLSKPVYSIGYEEIAPVDWEAIAAILSEAMQSLIESIQKAAAILEQPLPDVNFRASDTKQAARERSKKDVQNKRRELHRNKRNYTRS